MSGGCLRHGGVVVVMSWCIAIGQMTEEALHVLLLVPLIKSPALMPGYYLLFNVQQ